MMDLSYNTIKDVYYEQIKQATIRTTRLELLGDRLLRDRFIDGLLGKRQLK